MEEDSIDVILCSVIFCGKDYLIPDNEAPEWLSQSQQKTNDE
jgi:hypothetical protein